MRLGFFPYDAMNYKAGQAYLDRKAAKGWALRHIYLNCVARFEKVEAPRHFVDLDIRQFMDEEPDQDYIQLCADAGWEHIQTLRGMLFFRALPGRDPAPIQTDAGMEWERFWKKFARKSITTSLLVLLASVGLLAVVLAMTPGPGRSVTTVVTSNSALLYLLSLILGLVGILISFITTPLYLFRCRRSGQVETPGQITYLQDALCQLYRPFYLIAACIALTELLGSGTTVDLGLSSFNHEATATVDACREYPVILASDLGLPDSEDSRHLDGHRSLLAEVLNYSELTDGEEPAAPLYILTTERYDCAFEPLAQLVFALRANETRNGAFLWGELDWEEAPALGFDEGYVCRDGNYLLLRQGKVVALVGCSGLDLTTPENLEIVCDRLDLPPDLTGRREKA